VPNSADVLDTSWVDDLKTDNIRCLWRNPKPGSLFTIKVAGTEGRPIPNGHELTLMYDGEKLRLPDNA